MVKCYLRQGDDYLEDAKLMPSLQAAKDEFESTARELDRFGQKIEATIHIYDPRVNDAPFCHEYPDYVLSLGPKGGLRCDRA